MSADKASPADSGRCQQVPLDKVRALQHTLYRTAKADPGRRFHALWDKVLRRDVLWRAWVAVRINNGAPGIDRTTLDWIEKEYGIDRLLDELSTELRDGSYRPFPARRVYIPKPGTTEQRPLSIPAVRDRIVQAAVKIVLEPIFEADFVPCSFGFRPKRSQHDALQVLVDETWRGRRWVVETDIANCFSAIPHDRLMQAVEERVVDQSVLKLLRAMLRAGVMESGVVRHPETGTPQGGVISPSVVQRVPAPARPGMGHPHARGAGAFRRRPAGDVQVPSSKPRPRSRGCGRCWPTSAWRRRRPRPASSNWRWAARGFRFPRLPPPDGAVAGRCTVGAAWSSWPAGPVIGRCSVRAIGSRELTVRSRLLLPVEAVVEDLNRFLRGWADYFRYGHSAIRFGKIQQHARDRLALFIGKRHKRGRGFGLSVLAYQSTDFCGLYDLNAAPTPRCCGPRARHCCACSSRRTGR